MPKRIHVIAVAGGSGSGKTTFARKLVASISRC
jgi:uridine kinase